ncbi:17007_t:CDS:2, partial [Cetraspora pellucida]
WDSESLSKKASNSSEKTMDIGTARLSKNSNTNNSPTRQLQTPNTISEEPRTTIQENPRSILCKICFGKHEQHEYYTVQMQYRIYDYITQGLQDLELLKNLKEEQEDDEISDPKIPLLYSNNKERDFN